MRKLNKGRIFSRPKNQRVALFKALSTALFLHGKITTTEAKAKVLRSVAEKFITRGKQASLADRRLLARTLSPLVLKKLIDEISPKYLQRNGGYTRMTRLGARKSDSAKMVIIELV